MPSNTLREATLGKNPIGQRQSVLEKLPFLKLVFKDGWEGLLVSDIGEGWVA